jgi:hypothetical protein
VLVLTGGRPRGGRGFTEESGVGDYALLILERDFALLSIGTIAGVCFDLFFE